MNHKKNITFIGSGNMAESLINGLYISNPTLEDNYKIFASDVNIDRRIYINKKFGIEVFENNTDAIKKANIIVLSVKPQNMQSICKSLCNSIKNNQLIISIAAGISCNTISKWVGTKYIIRCMPNIACIIKKGATCLFANNYVHLKHRQAAEQLFAKVGITVWIKNEKDMNVITAISGSGPAYFFLLIKYMIQAAQKLGLSHEISEKLTLQTALGSINMINSYTQLNDLISKITSKKGTTEVAINFLKNNNFEKLLTDAIQISTDRSIELEKLFDHDKLQ